MDATIRHRVLYLVGVLLLTFDLLTCVHSQVVPFFQHNFPNGLQSVNGSSSNGGCTNILPGGLICGQLNENGTSDLVDHKVPCLGTLQDNWAAGLFTVNRSGYSSFHIGFELNGTFNVTTVELDLFNCPEWGIAAPSITVYNSTDILSFDREVARTYYSTLGSTTEAATSCNSTVTVCIPLQLPQNPQSIYIIDFTFNDTHDNIQWVHIAEVRFFEESACTEVLGLPAGSTCVIPTQTSQQHGPTTTILQQPTPEATETPPSSTSPLPTNTPQSNRSIIIPVITVVAVVIILILIGVVIIVVVFRTRKRKQQLEINKLQMVMMESENIKLELKKKETDLSNLHYDTLDNLVDFGDPLKTQNDKVERDQKIKDWIQTEEEHDLDTLIDNPHYDDPLKIRNEKISMGQENNDVQPRDEPDAATPPLYKEVKKEHPPMPKKSDELYSDLAAEQEARSSPDQPLYAAIQKEAPPSVHSKSEELVEYLEAQTQNSIPTSKCGDTPSKMVPADSEYACPAKSLKICTNSNPMFEEMESNPDNRSINKHGDPPSYTNVPQGTASDDIYTTPDIASSQTVGTDNRISEVVYSEPIQPSLFRDAVGSPSDVDDLQPCSPIYTVPTAMPKKEEMPLNVLGDNIREIRELGIGLFGKVILAETVGLSPKDLKMSKTDDDKSKSTLVAVKTLKSGAPSTTKEAFEKEVNFMSRMNDSNVIHILGVCHEDTPFIMMEYMENGDLNRYLRKFKVLSTTDSELQGQITTSTMIHITTQIASAMKYLASHNFVHRDLATRNCLVGQNYLVKISDFGMSRNLYTSHYYRIQGPSALPIRWMPTESFYGKFSQKSDVWAFGVTTWEIFTLAKERPYNNMSDQQVIQDATKGNNRSLLAKPDMCPPEVYEIMLKCWVNDTSQRATFEQLFQLLSSIHNDQ